jgi:hypothetical protein
MQTNDVVKVIEAMTLPKGHMMTDKVYDVNIMQRNCYFFSSSRTESRADAVSADAACYLGRALP